MTIKEAKENVIENFRRLNYPDHHEIEVFLLNTMEQLESIIKLEYDSDTMKAVRVLSKIALQKRVLGIIESYKNHSSHNPEDKCLEDIFDEITHTYTVKRGTPKPENHLPYDETKI